MRSFHALSLLTLVASVWASPIEDLPTNTLDARDGDIQCAKDGVLVLVARGTDADAPGPPTVDPQYTSYPAPLSSVAAAASSAGGGDSYTMAIPYPASGSPYLDSLQQGIDTTKTIIKNYVKKCGDNSKIVVTGYSQGAQVLSSALAGGAGRAGIPASLQKNIVAGALIADPSRVYPAGVDYNNTGAGGDAAATTDGCITLRHKTTAQETALSDIYGNVLRSFCAAGDNICAGAVTCAGGGNHIHQTECSIWYQQAIGFITPLIQDATA